VAAPASLLDLALTLHPALSTDHQDHLAHLAQRLGYAEVWLPVDAALSPSRLAALLRASGPTRVGLLVSGEAVLGGVGAIAGVLLEIVGAPSAGPALVHAVGGAEEWRRRVRLPSFDPTAAGTVVAGGSVPSVALAAAQRAAAGFSAADHPVFAALPVSIAGRESRAEPSPGGLSGTYDQVQGQVLELAAAGADGLRVVLPPGEDVADLLSQLRSVVASSPAGPTPSG
jgi:hypothetical protein